MSPQEQKRNATNWPLRHQKHGNVAPLARRWCVDVEQIIVSSNYLDHCNIPNISGNDYSQDSGDSQIDYNSCSSVHETRTDTFPSWRNTCKRWTDDINFVSGDFFVLIIEIALTPVYAYPFRV